MNSINCGSASLLFDNIRQRSIKLNLGLVARKPVFGVCGQVKLNPSCSATATSKRVDVLHIACLVIILSMKTNNYINGADQIGEFHSA